MCCLSLVVHSASRVCGCFYLQFLKVYGYVYTSLYPKGDIGLEMYILAKGTVEIVRYANATEEEILRVLEEGNYFGEICVAANVRRTATVRAFTYCNLLMLNKAVMDVWIAVSVCNVTHGVAARVCMLFAL